MELLQEIQNTTAGNKKSKVFFIGIGYYKRKIGAGNSEENINCIAGNLFSETAH
jgi:hypothetical protein